SCNETKTTKQSTNAIRNKLKRERERYQNDLEYREKKKKQRVESYQNKKKRMKYTEDMQNQDKLEKAVDNSRKRKQGCINTKMANVMRTVQSIDVHEPKAKQACTETNIAKMQRTKQLVDVPEAKNITDNSCNRKQSCNETKTTKQSTNAIRNKLKRERERYQNDLEYREKKKKQRVESYQN
ncbi:MAG: hypothetical protein GY702_13575, partial [Desulfobulbaceae bacterium]|nr:hypothetical protein [Desulfobulbaceae bacterium]